MKRKNLLFVLLCINFVAKGQITHDQISTNTQIFPSENTKLVINTNVLLAGESLQYKIYNHTDSGTLSSLSTIAYVSLRGVKDSVIFEHKLRLEKGMAQGSFFIPATLKTGIYHLFGYTNFSLNNSENGIASKSIYSINPYVKRNVRLEKEIDSSQQIQIFSNTIANVHSLSGANDLSIKTDKFSYILRESVNLTVENLNEETAYGNYVLSVRRLDPVQISDPQESHETYGIQNKSIFYLPELRGELIFGRVLTVNGEKPIENQIVSFTIPGKDYVFKMAKTNRYGRFFISIDEPYETANCIIQVVGPNKEQYKIVLDDTAFNSTRLKSTNDLQLDSGIKDWLQERSIQLQIQNAYFNEGDIIISEENSRDYFYGNVGRYYLLDDYTRFSTLKETFVEVVTLAKTRRKNGKEVFKVFDPYNPYKEDPRDPLLLLDGVLMQNHDEVLEHSAHDIEHVRVFPGLYRYGPEVFWGIIDIATRKGDFKPRLGSEYIKEFELESSLSNKKYSLPNYSNKALQRIPDYRTQLYWEATVRFDSKELSRNFYVSDVPGTYQIVLEGYSDDGKYVETKQYFEVKSK